MHNPYVVRSDLDVNDMLTSMGLTEIEQLLNGAPRSICLDRELILPDPLEEEQLDVLVRSIVSKNKMMLNMVSFLDRRLYTLDSFIQTMKFVCK